MQKILLHIAVLFVALALSVDAQDVPRVISYQGVLVGADGKPVTSSLQNPVKIKFEIINSSSQLIKDLGTENAMTVVGGLFTKPLDLSGISQNDFNQQLFLRLTVNDGTPYPPIPLYSTVSALNIPDNVVTSRKIKDGEVKAEDLSDMGATENQVLTRKNGQWRGDDVPKELPEQASEGAVLVFKNGQWQAENLVVPTGVPIGTIVAFFGLREQIDPNGDWLLCDGSDINNIEYPMLFEHLIKIYGIPKLPDLRGRFLRGADLWIGRDPDNHFNTGGRLYPIGASVNIENIGTVQDDALQNFKVELYTTAGTSAPSRGVLSGIQSPGGLWNTEGSWVKSVGSQPLRTSSETRPKNVYVNYIIKAR